MDNNISHGKNIEKVVSGSVKTVKKSDFRKFIERFITDDIGNIKEYIIDDVIIPYGKKILLESFQSLLGINASSQTFSNNSRRERESYTKFWRGSDDHIGYSKNNNITRSGYSYENIIFGDRGDLERVLSQMDDLIAEYKVVSVADLYDLVGKVGNYTDNNYGWTNIRNATAVRTRDGGYLLKLPKALPIN